MSEKVTYANVDVVFCGMKSKIYFEHLERMVSPATFVLSDAMNRIFEGRADLALYIFPNFNVILDRTSDAPIAFVSNEFLERAERVCVPAFSSLAATKFKVEVTRSYKPDSYIVKLSIGDLKFQYMSKPEEVIKSLVKTMNDDTQPPSELSKRGYAPKLPTFEVKEELSMIGAMEAVVTPTGVPKSISDAAKAVVEEEFDSRKKSSKTSMVGAIIAKKLSDDDVLRMLPPSVPSTVSLGVVRAKKFASLKPMIFFIDDECYLFATSPFIPLCRLDKKIAWDCVYEDKMAGEDVSMAFCEIDFDDRDNAVIVKVYKKNGRDFYKFKEGFSLVQIDFDATMDVVKDNIASKSVSSHAEKYPKPHSTKAVFTMMQELTDADLRKLSESILDDARLRNFFVSKEESNEVILEELPEPNEPEPVKKRELPKNFGAWGS